MKISTWGMDIGAGKIKYQDARVEQLTEKFQPQKVSPFFAEIIPDEPQLGEAIAALQAKALDLCILDMEKIEARLGNATDPAERSTLEKCLPLLEQETPLCDAAWDEAEQQWLHSLAPLTYKPTVFFAEPPDSNELIARALAKAGYMFFYTAGKKEVHAWLVKQGCDIVTCAAKIHTDLARGFIRGDVVGFDDLMTVHNLQEAKNNGLVQVVDRGHIVQDGDVIEIRFSV